MNHDTASVSSLPVRRAAVAGAFYPADRAVLIREIGDFLDKTGENPPSPGFPKAVIVPHAGYIYSGAVAAEAYDRLRGARGIVSRVVLLGPCHRVAVRGLALPGASAFETPLGLVQIDVDAESELRDLPQVSVFPATHAQEHSLEVQLPFLQEVLGSFRLVPLVVGSASPAQVAEVLERLWGGAETLIVISSDLSHYMPYDQARGVDAKTVQSILGLDTAITHEQACGATPVAGLLLAAKNHGLHPHLLDVRNSGDTAGGRGRVVGYASFAFFSGEPVYGPKQGEVLISLARQAIGAALRMNAAPAIPVEAWLHEIRATFVTLTLDGRLRGCIGMLAPVRPLGEDVVKNAHSAAFSDPRFPPLTREEFRRVQVEVSLLSVPKLLDFADHADLIARLEPGRDGLILHYRDDKGSPEHRGTFLPQVWESIPDPEQFIAQLKQKAGLSPTVRTERCRVSRYRVQKWVEGVRKSMDGGDA